MKKQLYIRNQSVRFRRFSRVAYAVFRSLHREVTIGRLAVRVADCQLRKSAAAVALCVPLLIADAALAQSDDEPIGLTLPVVTVTASSGSNDATPGASSVISHSVIRQLTATTVGELIEELPGVDVRMRGPADVQGDITMRGGTFDQVVVLLNGIPLTDPQTGHYNLDLPIDLSLVERVELLSPAALMRYGVAAFCGGINIVTYGSDPSATDTLRLALYGGSYGTAHLSAAADRGVGRWRLGAAAAYSRSDGHRANTDYSNASAMVQALRPASSGTWHAQIGATVKNFGSQAFYSLRYPYQYDATRTLTAALQRSFSIAQWRGDAALYGRLHTDRFELFRSGYAEAPSWYTGHNYHLSSSAGLRLRAARTWSLGLTTLGAQYHRDGIVSSVLGDSLDAPRRVWFDDGADAHYYSLGTARHRASLFADHCVVLARWQLSASALVNIGRKADIGYAATVRYQPTDSLHISASLARSFRQPTFTDLYYHSATQQGDPLLNAEQSHSADLAVHYARGHVAFDVIGYGRRGRDVIDWVRLADEEQWHSVNHAHIDALGADASLAYTSPTVVRRVALDVSLCHLWQQEDQYLSQYALDYLRHRLALHISLSPIDRLTLKLAGSYQQRSGHYVDADGVVQSYDPVLLVDASVAYKLRRVELFVEGHNLLGRSYYDYGGIAMPGFTLMAGLRL